MAEQPDEDHEAAEESPAGASGAPARAPLPDVWWRLPLSARRAIAAVIVLGIVGMIGAWIGGGEQRSTEREAARFVRNLPDERIETWDAVAACESESRWDLDTGNGFFGGLQFTLVSWSGVDGEGSPAAASRDEQIMRAEMLHELQGWEAWPRCSAQLGLR